MSAGADSTSPSLEGPTDQSQDSLEFLRTIAGGTWEIDGPDWIAYGTVKAGRSVAMLVDQRVPSGVEVQFFQQNSIATNLPARLALRFNSPIVPVSIERLARNQFHIQFDEAITVPDEPQTNAEQMMTEKMINSIEQMVHRSPETWFCNKRRWKGTTAQRVIRKA
jgi:lauroyl/myristoyl acyltransferase